MNENNSNNYRSWFRNSDSCTSTVIKNQKVAEGEVPAEGAEGETPTEGADAASKDGESAKKDEKSKEGTDKKPEDKKTPEKKPVKRNN